MGTGGIAARHLAALQAIGAEVVAHVSRDAGRAGAAAEKWGGTGYDDVHKMLDVETPDALWICVPPAAHGEPELAALERGVPLFVEKPLSASAPDAERLAAAVRTAGIPVAVGYHFRAFDHVAAVREELTGRTVELVRGAWHGETPAPAWWRNKTASGGQLVEQATHVLDLARHLAGEADAVCAGVSGGGQASGDAASDVDRATAAMVRFRGGAIGTFTATRILSGATDVGLELYCDGIRIAVDRTSASFTTAAGTRTVAATGDPFVTENRAFLHAVQTGDAGAVLCTYDDALATHRLCCDLQGMADATTEGGRSE